MKLKSEFSSLTPETRLHGLNVPVIGLTGGIATGKSTVSELLRQRGLKVIDADQLVKTVYAQTETREFLAQHHPEVLRNGEIDFPLLREKAFSDNKTREALESFIYQRLPAVFREEVKKQGSPAVVIYDVPLLFEKNLASKVDLKVLVYALRESQLSRLMQRDGSSEELANKILDKQWDIEEKRKLADYVIVNDSHLDHLIAEVDAFIRKFFH